MRPNPVSASADRPKIESGIPLEDGEIYLSVKQAAQRFHVLPSTIHYHIDRGNLRYKFVANRYWISLKSLQFLYTKRLPTKVLKVRR